MGRINEGKTAVTLLSGGLDSSTVAALAKSQGFNVETLSFHYSQRNKVEIEFAKRFTKKLGARHRVINIDPTVFSEAQSSLVNTKNDVENASAVGKNEIPNTYVPARNLLFLAHAISYAESINSTDIFLGVNVVDYGNYPDCRPDFISAVQVSATLASKNCQTQKSQFNIHTPIISMNKKQIIELGISLGVDYSLTISCYQPRQNLSCGECLSCRFRKQGFLDANIQDPTKYYGQ